MKEKQRIYAKLLLNTCLKVEKNQPLLIIAPTECYEFIRIVTDEASKMGVSDIGYYFMDSYMQHSLLQNIEFDKLKDHPLFSKEIYNEYAKKNAAFMCLYTETPGIMEDIDPKIISKVRINAADTSMYYDECRSRNELAWLIAMVPTIAWAKEVYPNIDEPLEKLWNTIFELCFVNEEDPEAALQNDIAEHQMVQQKLNALKIKELHYQNELGTDLRIGLSERSLWQTGISKLKNGKEILCNYPSVEVFTTPNKYQVNGVVYSTLPLLTSGVVIEGLRIEFKDGKIISVTGKKNGHVFKDVVDNIENACYLGEAALVPYDSKIRNTETLFYTTLLDENASCHLAIGAGFTECYEGSDTLNEEECTKIGLNVSKTHIDFMIGSKDLNITATTYDNQEIKIFENGNFSKDILD